MSALDRQGYSLLIANSIITISLNNIHYETTCLINGLYVLNLNDNVLSIENKKIKHFDLDITYLWHCRLNHIGLKRILKLHKDMVL